jgi:hypothetical protein
MASTAYTRPSKPPGPVGERRQPRLAKELGRIEPKKLGIGLVAGCCLALLTYISFARLFAIYSPVFGEDPPVLCSFLRCLFGSRKLADLFIVDRELAVGDKECAACLDYGAGHGHRACPAEDRSRRGERSR